MKTTCDIIPTVSFMLQCQLKVLFARHLCQVKTFHLRKSPPRRKAREKSLFLFLLWWWNVIAFPTCRGVVQNTKYKLHFIITPSRTLHTIRTTISSFAQASNIYGLFFRVLKTCENVHPPTPLKLRFFSLPRAKRTETKPERAKRFSVRMFFFRRQ